MWENTFNKIHPLDSALSHIHDGITLMYGGFGGVGTSPLIIDAIVKKNVKNLVLIGNDAGFPEVGVGRLIGNDQVSKMITTHIGSNPVAGRLMSEGKLEVEFSPQGIFAERVRAGGAGIEGILSDTGIGTFVGENKQTVVLNGKDYLVEPALRARVGIVYAKAADAFGNCVYEKTARNMNPLVAMASEITIVHAREIVAVGELDPEQIVTPGVFVDIIVTGEEGRWKWSWQ